MPRNIAGQGRVSASNPPPAPSTVSPFSFLISALMPGKGRVAEPPDHAQADLALRLLLGEEGANLLGGCVAESDHASANVALGVAMPNSAELESRIKAAFPGARVSVEDLTGGGDHFRAEVESDRFDGLNRIE